MSFGAPLGLLALLAIPAIVLAYVLRRRSPPRTVSAAFLWRATEEVVESGPRFKRLQRETSLLLEIAAVLCAAAFLADLRCSPREAGARHVVVVLDSSLSMRGLGADGRSFSDRAKTKAKAIMSDAGAVTLVETGPRPKVLAGPAASVDEATEALEKWAPSRAGHSFAASWALAQELAGGGRIVFFTDGVPEEALPREVALEAVGEARPNVALASASRTDTSAQTRLRLRVQNDADTPAQVPLVVRDSTGKSLQERTLDLAAGAAEAIVVELPRTGPVDVSLPPDALPDDSQAHLLPSPKPVLWVKNALDANTPAGAAIARLVTTAPDVRVGEPSALVFSPPGAGTPPWTVTVGASGEAANLRSFVGPFFADRRTPLLDDVSLDGVVWTAGENPPGAPLLTAGDRVLLSEEPGPRFHLNIDLARSNVQRTQAWPILLANLLDLRRAALPGFSEKNVPVGARIPLDVDASAKWELRGPTTRALVAGAQDLGPLAPGEWVLVRDGSERDRLSVLAIDESESDLRHRGEASKQAASASEGLAEQQRARSLLPILLLLACLVADYTFAAPGLGRAFRRGTT